MSLKRLLDQGRLKRHKTSGKEIKDLLGLAARDIKDAKAEVISLDRRFATAYNGILQLAMVLLYCDGYEPKGVGHHASVFEAMKVIMGKDHCKLADYFDSCRSKRNITDYDYAGGISRSEVDEIIKEAEEFSETVRAWLKANYSDLL